MKTPRSYLSLSKLVLAGTLLYSHLSFAQSPAKINVPAPSEPGIFGIGFTNITDSSARLVFTTSEPMSATVMISEAGKKPSQLDDAGFSEIHAINLPNLIKGNEYHIIISGVTHGGTKVVSKENILTPIQRPASKHQWPGHTIIGTSVGEINEASLDLLADTGVHMVRIEASWSNLFPVSRELNQSYFNDLVQKISQLKKRNIEPLLVLDYCVPWAKPYTNTTMTWRHPAFGPPDSLEDWEFYIRKVVTSFRDSVKYYEIWNEPDAGYLSTGNYVERPNLPPPIARLPFKDNWNYWLGDRFVPMIERVRTVLDELEPDALVMNGGWNRDYTGQRGDLLFERGTAPYLDLYAFHCYSSQPMSFIRWYTAIDGGFRTNIDRIFNKHKVRLPVAVTEWGWPSWEKPDPAKGFVTFEDAQKFFVKSAFYFLALQRVEILMQFELGITADTRDKDPLFFTLVTHDEAGKITKQPSYSTFRWLVKTFDERTYRALPVQTSPAENVKAFAIQLKDSGETYLAVWQDGVPDAKGVIAAAPSREVEISIGEIEDGNYALQVLDMAGSATLESQISVDRSFKLKATLPEITASAESGIYLVKIAKANTPAAVK